MHSGENIKLSVTQLTIHARSKHFSAGSVRLASYARTASSTSKYVVKSFKYGRKTMAHIAEDIRIQALCKSFALVFNGLLKIEPPIDFVMTYLQSKGKDGEESDYLSLEPYSTETTSSTTVTTKSHKHSSHLTFGPSWGHFLVNDLQGVVHLLTDPAIQTSDPDRL